MEVQMERGDPTDSVVSQETDFEEVLFSYADLERKIREIFCGKNCDADIVDHSKKGE